jgi:hypothetical protein
MIIPTAKKVTARKATGQLKLVWTLVNWREARVGFMEG